MLPPPPGLAHLVEHTFVLDMRTVTGRSWKIVPDASAHLLAHRFTSPDGGERIRTSVVGSRTRGLECDPRGRIWTVGVRLRPGALAALTGIDATELTDSSASFGDVWGARGDTGASAMTSVPSAEHAVRRLLRIVEIEARGRERPWVARAFDDAVRARPRASVSGLAGLLGIAPRTLRRRYRSTTGLAPKRHLRITRLHEAIALGRRRPDDPWGRIAAAAGFSDQAHLVRDFQALVAETPVAFRARGRRADSFKARPAGSSSF